MISFSSVTMSANIEYSRKRKNIRVRIQEAFDNFKDFLKDFFEEPFESVKYSGENDTQHPKTFIKTFEEIAVENDLNEFEKQYYFIESLVDEAAIWLKTRGFGTYEEMKNDFLNFYAKSNKQQSFTKHLNQGKHDQNCELPMTEIWKRLNFNKIMQTKFNVQPVKSLKKDLKIDKTFDALKNSDKKIKPIQFRRKLNKFIFLKRQHEYNHTILVILMTVIFCLLPLFVILLLVPTAKVHHENMSAIYPFDHSDLNYRLKLIPFETLKFFGRNNSVHPVNFVRNFEHIAAQENLDDFFKKKIFIDSLVGEAQDWFNIWDYETYEEIKKGFLDFYWSPAIQKTFLDYLKNSKYDEKSGLSISGYFFKYVNEAKLLDNPPSEKEVISDLLNHFNLDWDTKIVLNLRPVNTVRETLDILTSMETFGVLRNKEPFTEELMTSIYDINVCDKYGLVRTTFFIASSLMSFQLFHRLLLKLNIV